MASFKFDCKKFMRELEREIKNSVQRDVEKKPKKVLNKHIGKHVSACCPRCGNFQMEVLAGGIVRCPVCEYKGRAEIQINWR